MATIEVRANSKGHTTWDEKAADIQAYISAMDADDRTFLADTLGDLLGLGTWRHIQQAGIAKYATPRTNVTPAPAPANDAVQAQLNALSAQLKAVTDTLMKIAPAPKPEVVTSGVSGSSRSARKTAREKAQ